MLFDPGTRTVAFGDRVSGLISSLSGYDGIEDITATVHR
jgi:hypothetical protein